MFSKNLFNFVLLLQICAYDLAFGYKTGAPDTVCDTMVPGHGFEPQQIPSPYKLTLNKKSVRASSTLSITLSAAEDYFRGFMFQVRKEDGDTPLGKFTYGAQAYKTLDCNEEKQTAATHNSPDPRRAVTVQWSAPSDDSEGNYQVYYTVVKDGPTYWTSVTPAEGKFSVVDNADDEEVVEEKSEEEGEEGEDDSKKE